jgi:hypothetical protein
VAFLAGTFVGDTRTALYAIGLLAVGLAWRKWASR